MRGGVMAVKKRSTKFYLIMAFFVSALIFASGLGIGLVVDEFKSTAISSNLADMSNSLQDAEIELLLFNYFGSNVSCNYLMLKTAELSDESTNLGNKLNLFEESNQVNSGSYIPLKEDYMRVLVKNWLTIENIKTSCNADYTTILYFYNQECGLCDNQAFILSYFKELYTDDLMVFAIDAGLNMSLINLLRYNYGVYEYPSLVINGKFYSGYQNATVINEILTK